MNKLLPVFGSIYINYKSIILKVQKNMQSLIERKPHNYKQNKKITKKFFKEKSFPYPVFLCEIYFITIYHLKTIRKRSIERLLQTKRLNQVPFNATQNWRTEKLGYKNQQSVKSNCTSVKKSLTQLHLTRSSFKSLLSGFTTTVFFFFPCYSFYIEYNIV